MPYGDDPYSRGVLSHEIPTEQPRLRLLEEMLNPTTKRVLQGRGIQSGWRCLELGAGNGGIARWLTEQCPDGHVVAADIDTRFLDVGWAGNLEVRQFDVLTEEFPAGSFDLIHARALFMQLPARNELIAKVAAWLAPGGWLVVEDIDIFTADTSAHPLWRKVFVAVSDLVALQGTDVRWARRNLPGPLGAAGLTDLGLAIEILIAGMGEPGDDFWRVFLSQTASALIDEGLLTADEIERVRALLDDPGFLDSAEALVSAWGRRPL